MDYFTAVSNCLGVPALTVPIYEDNETKNGTKFNGFPTSIRMQGFFGEDFHLLRIGNEIDRLLKANDMLVR